MTKTVTKNKIRSVEPLIADLANGWMKSYNLDYKLEQEPLNTEIDKALDEYLSKSGGKGGNRPDAKLLLQDKNLNYWPVLIEYKGYKGKLEKLDSCGNIDNLTARNEPNYSNIKSFAVNGAVHYANALLHHTSYTDIIAIGMTGYKDELGKLKHSIAVYYVSKNNLGVGQKVGEYTDLSFLPPPEFDKFIEKVKTLNISAEQLEQLRERKEQEIKASLVKLNNDIYQNEKNLSENDRVYLVASSIIATLGVPGKVKPLEKEDLKSSPESGETDGEIILRKIKAFLTEKALPETKKELIIRTLQNTLTSDNLNKITAGETQLKRVFNKIVDDLGRYYKIGLTTDFTGKLFNEMYGWLGFSQDKLNDVVLTPSYVAKLLVKLARVDRNSYVWDFATGSAGLLVAAMNEMLIDAKKHITSPDELARKEATIRAEQLLGLEVLPSIYMLAILNMILMGDGSSNILNKDSLHDFDGKYGFGKITEKFPASAFVLNPPYSASGNGMIFVEKALGMMEKGYAAIIIQGSSGSGKATDYNRRILKKHTLLASIKMPIDLFIGKSNVQTYVYVFRVNEPHQADDTVKFIDFSNDGYTRTNRKKASVNLKDTSHAKERYEEVVQLVRFGKDKLNYLTEKEYYEGKIDPKNGADWNQAAPVDTRPTFEDFNKTITDYLSWEVSSLIKRQAEDENRLGKITSPLKQKLSNVHWQSFILKDLFGKSTRGKRLKSEDRVPGNLPFVTAGETDEGVSDFIGNNVTVFSKNTITIDMFGSAKYRNYDYGADDHIAVVHTESLNKNAAIFVTSAIHKSSHNGQFDYGRNFYAKDADALRILLPEKEGQPDYELMAFIVSEVKKLVVKGLVDYTNKLLKIYSTL